MTTHKSAQDTPEVNPSPEMEKSMVRIECDSMVSSVDYKNFLNLDKIKDSVSKSLLGSRSASPMGTILPSPTSFEDISQFSPGNPEEDYIFAEYQCDFC